MQRMDMQRSNAQAGKGRLATNPRHRIGLRAFPGLLLVLGILVGLSFSAMAGDELEVGGHSFQYLGVTNNADGTSTWTYRVSSGSKPSLSHWVLEWAESMDESLVVDASEDYEVNTDPRTGTNLQIHALPPKQAGKLRSKDGSQDPRRMRSQETRIQ